MRRALKEYVITGIRTNLGFHDRLMSHPSFVAGDYDTGFIDAHREALLGDATLDASTCEAVAVAAALAAARLERGAAKAARSECVDASKPSPWVATHRIRRLS
jgi:acetyl-CoA carboxylase biotin carboxylase subunit